MGLSWAVKNSVLTQLSNAQLLFREGPSGLVPVDLKDPSDLVSLVNQVH